MRIHKVNHLSDIDMSPEGIDRRLRDLGQIYRLGMELKKAHRLGKVKDLGEPKKNNILEK